MLNINQRIEIMKAAATALRVAVNVATEEQLTLSEIYDVMVAMVTEDSANHPTEKSG